MKRALIVLLALCLLLAAGCTQMIETATKKVVSMGEMNDGTYTNDYFGLTFSVPEDWTILSQEEMLEITKEGNKLIAGDDESKEEMLDLAKVKVLNLASAYKHELGYLDGYNPNIACIGENLSLAGLVIKTGEDYLNATKEVLEGTDLSIEFKDIVTETLGSKEFDVLQSEIDLGVIVVTQKMYATIIDGYALFFTISYADDEQKAELEDILDTITFE